MPEAEKRQQIGVRTSPELKEQLEIAAGQNGRSVAQEAELRLLQSFERDAIKRSPATEILLNVLASDIALVEGRTGKSWADDPASFEAVRLMIESTVSRRKPRPENYEESLSFLQEEMGVQQREADLRQALINCGVLAYRPNRGLLAIVDPSQKMIMEERPEDEWRDPEDPDAALSDEALTVIRKRLDEYREIQASLPERARRLEALNGPQVDAKQRGEAIYREITSTLFGESKSLGDLMKGQADGA